MNEMINFGIDLGTTNSLIAKANKGSVEVYKNPNGFKETLPSVVAFRNDRIMVGEQARTFAEKDSQSVASRFKRKMGTTETIKIKSLNASKTPVELSAFVLKELKTFVHTGEVPEAVVITIPASFDTVQSNATKEAGYQAGFKQVVLLAEPIAASLAYANREKNIDLSDSKWIVYDLGGGTFDVALARIAEGELIVADHEGDNYLGGSDIDSLIVERIIVPELNKRGTFADLVGQMKSETGKYNRLWTVLLHRAEEAKIELSTKASAEIDLGMIRDLHDDEGKVIDFIIGITRSDFEAAIRDLVDATAGMLRKILTRNSLQPHDLKFVLMVGGSTYIPYVRKRVEELLGIPVNTNIDPTSAIAIGAAYFAATKPINDDHRNKEVTPSGILRIKGVYNRASVEREELFSARVEGETVGLFYRITRDDGAFDSGLKVLTKRIVEDLPLQEGAFNSFTLKVYDGKNNPVPVDTDSIQIAHGYTPHGQLLPEDLSLVKDNVIAKDTQLFRLFAKNSVLPAKTKHSVEVGKTIPKDSAEQLRLIVVEGSADNHSSTNKQIGMLVLSGQQLSRDLLRGTEIDLTIEMSESRDLMISAYLNGTGQEFSQVFTPNDRDVKADTLADEINHLEFLLVKEQTDAESSKNATVLAGLSKLRERVEELIGEATLLIIDSVTDDKFKLDDKKKQLAQEMFRLTAGNKLEKARGEYHTVKREVSDLVSESGNDKERHQLAELLSREYTFTSSSTPAKVEAATAALESIRWQILVRTPDFLVGMFQHLVERRASMNDELQAKNLIEAGKRQIVGETWDQLRETIGRLVNLLPQADQKAGEFRLFTGIV